jgi:exopolysaccharide biosynthesis polyprenyl glycosylphosphotransferase
MRKPPQSVRPAVAFPIDAGTTASTQTMRESVSESALELLVPRPLTGRSAANWLRSIAADFVLVGLNWLFAGALVIGLDAAFPQAHLVEQLTIVPGSLLGLALLHAALITLLGYSEGLYEDGIDLVAQARMLGKALLWATALLCVAYRLQGSSGSLVAVACGAGLLHFGSLLAWRWQERRRGSRQGKQGKDSRNVLIVGAGGVGRRVAAYVDGHPEAGRTVIGFLDDDRPLGEGVIGRVNNLAHLARTWFVDEVMLTAPHDRNQTLRVLNDARRLRLDVEIVPDLFGFRPAGEGFERVGDLPVICVHAERLPAAALLAKRAIDIVGASLGIIALAPVLATIAACIRAESEGPVLYAAQRAGRKGRLFRCYKFRTMVSDADALKKDLRNQNQRSGPTFKIADDPRITRVGRWLRRYSLDELPQLWNVLNGEMSLVGPRPHPLDDFAAYEIEHLARLDVTPGITGLWQVTARRDPSFERGIELDREYIRTWSLGMDVRILLKTVFAVVQGSGD